MADANWDAPQDAGTASALSVARGGTASADAWDVPQEPPEAKGILESAKAGWQLGNIGLLMNQKLPTIIASPEHQTFWEQLATGVGTLAGDLPSMIAGGVAGSTAGAAAGTAVAGPPGTVGGGIAGGFAGMSLVPSLIRQATLDFYKSGAGQTKEDFWNMLRESAATIAKDTGYGAATGAVLGPAGRVIGRAVGSQIGKTLAVPVEEAGKKAIQSGGVAIAQRTAETAALIAAMPTIPALLQGHLPDMAEFGHAGIIIGGLTAGHIAVGRVMSVYEKTGKTPAEQVADVKEGRVPATVYIEGPDASSLRPPAEDMFGKPYNPTGTASGVPLALDRLIADAQQLGRGGIPEAPDVKGLVRELKAAGPLQGDMVSGIDRLGELITRAKEIGPLTEAERAEADKIKTGLAAASETITAEHHAKLSDLAAKRLAELDAKADGTPETTLTRPDGEKQAVPGKQPEFLTDAERAERVFLKNNATNPTALAKRYRIVEPQPAGRGEPMTRKEAHEVAPDSAFNGDSAKSLEDIVTSDTYTGAPIELTNRGFTAEEIAGLERAGMATDGKMSREQFTRYDNERGARLAGKSTMSRPALRTAISRAEFDASAERLHDDVLRQLKEADQARREAGEAPLGDEHGDAVAALVRARVRARAQRLGMLPEEVYRERPLQIRDQAQADAVSAEAEIPAEAPRFTPPEVDLFGNPVEPTNAPRHAVEALATTEVPLKDLVLSKEVPQFKHAADERGVVTPLGGEPDRTGMGPIQVWERTDGTLEVISGRHRLELFTRKGQETIPAQIHRESEGFTRDMAAMLDAELNIRDEQGSVADYVQYLKATGLTKEAADARGLLARAKGRSAFAIARDASPDLVATHRAGLLSDEAALAISQAAPGSERLQALGIAVVNDGKSALYAVNMMKSVELMASERIAEGKQGDIFGFDDSAMREAQAMAKKASSQQRHITEQISAVSGASRRPEIARKMGVDVHDPEGITKRIQELKVEQMLWDNWPLHPELVAKLRTGALGQGPVGEGRVAQARARYALKPQGENLVGRDVDLEHVWTHQNRQGMAENEDVKQFRILDKEGRPQGVVNVGFQDGKIAALLTITTKGKTVVFDKSGTPQHGDFPGLQGWGEKTVRALAASAEDTLHLKETVTDAVAFWEKMGAQWATEQRNHENAQLSFEQHAEARPKLHEPEPGTNAVDAGDGRDASVDAAGGQEPSGDRAGDGSAGPSPDTSGSLGFDLTPETPAELRARDVEAAQAAHREVNLKRALERASKVTADQADLFNTQNTLFQSDTFYSELGRQIDSLKMGRAPAQGWKDTIKGMVASGKVKAAEVEALQLNEWLEAQEGRVTKEQVQDYIKGNGLKIVDVQFGNAGTDNLRRAFNEAGYDIEIDEAGEEYNYTDRAGEFIEFAFLPDELQQAVVAQIEAVQQGDQLPTRFPQYQLPGGKNYREAFITMPGVPSADLSRPKPLTELPEGYETILDRNGPGGRTIWGVTPPGQIHARFMGGAHASEAEAIREALILVNNERLANWAADKGKKNWNDGHGAYDEVKNPIMRYRYNERTDAEGKRVLFLEEVQQPIKAEFAKMPKYLQDNWLEMGLKRVIHQAIQEGFDRVSWTTGEQQVERWTGALRSQVDRIEWTKTPEGVQIVGYKGGGVDPAERSRVAELERVLTRRALRPAEREELRDLRAGSNRRKVVDTTQKEDALSDAIGKAMAERIINDPAQSGTIEGEGITIDKTWPAKLYDRQVPRTIEKIAAKLGGGKVVEARMDTGAKEFGDTTTAQQSIEITDKMRERAQQGMPLFQEQQDRNRGQYERDRNLITTLQGADKSTVVHELWHSWLEEMKADAERPDAPAQIKADWELMRKEYGIPASGPIPRAAHELGARTGERYLMEGKAPTPELQPIFERFKNWLVEIYRSVMNLNAVEINPELRAVLDRMLATDEELAAARELNVPKEYAAVAKAEEAKKIVPPPDARRKIEPGFAAEQASMIPFATELPPGPGKAPDEIHVNYEYVNSPLDVKLAMQRMAEIDQANIQRHRDGEEGVKTWEQSNAEQAKYLNDVLGGDPDTLKILAGRDPAAPGVDIKLGIMKKLVVGAAEDANRRRDVVLAAGHDATIRQQLEYMGSLERLRMIQAEFLGERAGVARALNALKDTTEGTGEVSKMLEAIGVGDTLFQAPRTPAEEQAYMKAQLDEILQNYKGRSVLDIAKLHREIGTLKGSVKFAEELSKATKWEMLVEGWKAGLLSGPVTHTTNLFGTGAFQAMRAPVDLLASIIGMARGAAPGMGETDRASMSEAVARITGMLGGVQDGLRAAGGALSADQVTGKTESYRPAIPGAAGHWIRLPLRLMGAEDALVSTMYHRGEMRTLALRQAFDENLRPSTREFAERVDNLVDHPTPEMQAKADAAATRMTFNSPLGEKGVALQLFVNKWNLQWMIPFIRTPINIAKELARMSPFAPVVGEWRQAIARGGVERDRALAEITIGTGIMAVTMSYAFQGNVSGAGSPDPGKNRGKAGVWQPYSILVGDRWYEYGRIQPTGTLMGLAADLANVWDHATDEEKDKIPKMLAIAFSNAVTNQTFLAGITNFVNATSDPARFGPRFIQGLAASTVPNVIGQPTAMADPMVREVNSALEAIQARIPGMRTDLLPKRDWLGEPVETKERMGYVMPVREQPVSDDKVRQEAARLDISMAAAPKKTHIGKGTGKLGDVELTPEERDKFEEVGGKMARRILTNIVNAQGYDQIPDLVKRNIFAKVLTASHRVAAIQAMPMEKRLEYLQSITEKVQSALEPETQ